MPPFNTQAEDLYCRSNMAGMFWQFCNKPTKKFPFLSKYDKNTLNIYTSKVLKKSIFKIVLKEILIYIDKILDLYESTAKVVAIELTQLIKINK